MGSKVTINKQAIAKMQREIQREFDKRPIRVPISAESPQIPGQSYATTVNHYHAPVVTISGDRAQVAWGDGGILQNQDAISEVTPGYEAVANIVAEVLAKLGDLALTPDEEEEVQENGERLLAEVVKSEPDKGIIRHATTMLRGLLASAATGLNQAVTSESSEFARQAIAALGQAILS